MYVVKIGKVFIYGFSELVDDIRVYICPDPQEIWLSNGLDLLFLPWIGIGRNEVSEARLCGLFINRFELLVRKFQDLCLHSGGGKKISNSSNRWAGTEISPLYSLVFDCLG